jgi:hypothetical protein
MTEWAHLIPFLRHGIEQSSSGHRYRMDGCAAIRMEWRLVILPKRVEKDRGVEASERVIGRMGLVTFGSGL